MSLASADAARARREAANTVGYYNLKVGPTAWSFSAGLGLEANDNIQLESSHQRQDVIFHPEFDTRMLWPISEVNNLNLALGAGYSAYMFHPEFNRFFIGPGSELSFDIYTGDFWINLHDRFSITENTYQDPTVVGSANYSLLQNSLGVGATWDLNKAVAKLGYDHVSYVSLGTGSSGVAPSGESEVFSSSAGLTIRPGTLAGLELGGSLFSYSQTSTNQVFRDATQWSVGPFLESQVSQYLRGRVSAGYTVYMPSGSTSLGPGVEFSGVYAEADLTHRVNQYVNYTLSAGRSISFAFFGGTVDLYYARWQANWNLIRKLTLGTSFEFEHGTQLATVSGAETFDRYGPGFSIGRVLTAKLTGSLAYQFYKRGSNLDGRDYSVNVATLSLQYRF